ncbi:AAA family ATPase [Flavobacteriaceae bacterium F89]|uniref:gluconokinase n=1 Tax=Cerina litoralis TaxID=2874477 RepID=A0AAE3EYB7_9FLAO|nr:shikimate kinase [Cerina litoralis]MCG2462399.1 AAA family ATPase [Cerina litoralis]
MKNYNYIVILVGVCGTGKSAVGQKVAQRLEVPFFDADKLPTSNYLPKGKLPQEVDLEKWLTCVEGLIATQSTQKGCVISCSVLKVVHRRRLSANIDHQLDWVYMNASYDNVAQRVEQLRDNDRSASVLKSDFETLEAPKRALTIDMTYPEGEIVDTILKYLARKYG